MARMRVTVNVAGGNHAEKRLVDSPSDWWESYSNINVEAWVYMWMQEIHRLCLPTLPAPQYQYYIAGRYTIGLKKDPPTVDTRQAAKKKMDTDTVVVKGKSVRGSFVDFAWLPPNKQSHQPIVLFEVDENAHNGAGWDAERYRELFVFEHFKTEYPYASR